MRIRIVLYNKIADAGIPINYNHFLAATIYRILREQARGSCNLSLDRVRQGARMHLRMFTFSHLNFETYRIEQEKISFDEGYIQWYISSPVAEFLLIIAQRIAKCKELLIAGVRFDIEKVEVLKEVDFSDEMSFTALSPITVTHSKKNRHVSRYLRYTEKGFAEAVRENLIKKYILIHNAMPKDNSLVFTFDQDYLTKKAGKIQKKISFLNMEVIGFVAPSKVKGSPELIRVGYDAGFGEKGNLGFGMVKIIRKEP
ncbi:MAG: CRISPR-associated endoribonuclease Cas6 [Nitrospirae bacterium]|uniref:CRISPR-associated endoribonuclease Cas6 n=1 Tax=Candidatus Magnetobacterium casense TaxID=1455061 RepID=UPI00058B46BF|nr:CRISPR-associated endoribonuclease Cas6 [Candidatus Magnetobacterium casensis]MBF0339081.1 CRISPR-associated endoribonuclease Cas6 [Nitrospirota bacterium]